MTISFYYLQLHNFFRDPVLKMVFLMWFGNYVFASYLNCKLFEGEAYVSC